MVPVACDETTAQKLNSACNVHALVEVAYPPYPSVGMHPNDAHIVRLAPSEFCCPSNAGTHAYAGKRGHWNTRVQFRSTVIRVLECVVCERVRARVCVRAHVVAVIEATCCKDLQTTPPHRKSCYT